MTQIILFNKPYGIPSTFTDSLGRETLKSYIPVEGVYSAGRLDLDSEGLLLLTDDGELIHQLTDPVHHILKTYLVQVEGVITIEALTRLERGVEIQGYQTRPCRVMPVPEPELAQRAKPITPHGPTGWVRIELGEGKKRQIRHMTAAVGLPTLRIVRVAIGPIQLDELKSGTWRALTAQEEALLRKALENKSSARKRAGAKTGRNRRTISRGGN